MGVPCLTKGEHGGGGKGKIKNRGATSATKGEPGVNPRLVKEAEANLCHPGEIRKGCSKFFCRMRAGGIRQRVVNVEVPNHKGGVREVGKGNQGGHRHLRGPLRPEVVNA